MNYSHRINESLVNVFDTESNSEIGYNELVLWTILIGFLTSYFSYFLVKLTRKNELNAATMMEINVLADFTLNLLVVLQKLLQGINHFLTILLNFSTLCGYMDLSIVMVNGCLMIFWNIYYNERVTRISAIILMTIVKITNLLIAFTLSKSNEGCMEIQKNFLSHQHFFFSTLPLLFFLLIGLVSSAYTTYIYWKERQNRVVPVSINTISKRVNKNQSKNEEQINPFEESSSETKVETPRKQNKFQNDQCRIAWTDTLPKKNFCSNLQDNINEALEMIKKSKTYLKFNIIIVCLLGCLLPENIVRFYNFLWNEDCQRNEKIEFWYQTMSIISLPVFLMYPILVQMKIKQFQQL